MKIPVPYVQPNIEPRKYQTDCIMRMLNDKRLLLLCTVSGGKTLITLEFLHQLKKKGILNKALIVGPVIVTKETWPTEIEKFNYDETLSYNLLTPLTTEGAIAKSKDKADVDIINKDKLINFIVGKSLGRVGSKIRMKYEGILNDKNRTPYNVIIIDESTSFKSNSRRNKNLRALIRKDKPEYIILLTGQPRTNSEMDLFYQYRLLFEASEEINPLGRYLKEFTNSFFNATQELVTRYVKGMKRQYNDIKYTLRPDAIEMMSNLLAPYTKVITMDNVRDSLKGTELFEGVKPPIVHNVVLDMTPRCRKMYNQLKKSEVYSIGKDLDINIKTDDELVFQMGNRQNKLRQFLCGFTYYNFEDMIVNDLADEADIANASRFKKAVLFEDMYQEKIKAVKEIINKNTKGVLILFNFAEEYKILEKEIEGLVLLNSASSNKVIKDWNDGNLKVIAANPASISHGLNLQFGGNTWIWLSPPYSYEFYMQSNARIPRPGQLEQTHMYCLQFKRTIEVTSLYEKLADNEFMADEFRDKIKEASEKYERDKYNFKQAYYGYGYTKNFNELDI